MYIHDSKMNDSNDTSREKYVIKCAKLFIFHFKSFQVASIWIKYYLIFAAILKHENFLCQSEAFRIILKPEPWEVKVLFVTCYDLI